MLIRPVDYLARPLRRIYWPERLSTRTAILLGSIISFSLWAGIGFVLIKLL